MTHFHSNFPPFSAQASLFSIPIPPSPNPLSHVYCVIYRERYGVTEIIYEKVISKPQENSQLVFDVEWLKKHKTWSCTVQGYQQKALCCEVTKVFGQFF